MLQSLKQKTLVGKLWAIIVLAGSHFHRRGVRARNRKNDRWADPFHTAG